MADFVAVLKKTLDGLADTSPAMRARVYEKARATVSGKLAALDPPPPQSVVDRQKRSLEEAIAAIEREYAAASAQDGDPLAELENVFASLKNPQPSPDRSQAAASARAERAEPAAQPTQPVHHANDAAAVSSDADDFPDEMAPEDTPPPFDPPRYEATRKRSYGKLLAAAVVLAMLAGGAFGIWLNKDAFGSLLGLGETEIARVPARPQPEPEPAPAAETTPAPAAEAPAPAPEETKFTQRLTPDGSEVDPGPAGGEASIGEGTSVAALTQPPSPSTAAPEAVGEDASPAEGEEAVAPGTPEGEDAEPETEAAAAAPTATEPAAAVLDAGTPQKAIFYEERTSSAEGSAEPGTIRWSLIQESPGANLPPEPAIRAEASIPGKDVQLRMTIKRNADRSLPASHIIEMIFLTPEGFEGGGIENILRVAMKGSEQEAGNPLIGIPAKIADGFFLVALNDTRAEIEANMTLLRRQSWIDVPVVYRSGRRALLTMEKGEPGDKVFDEALKAWQAASAG